MEVRPIDKKITKKTCVCECTNSARVTADIARLEFFWPGPAPRAGQFFLLKPRRTAVFLARPISVAGWKPQKQTIPGNNDRNQIESGGTLCFLVAIRGQGTRELAAIQPNEEVELSGPLGNSWPHERVPSGPVALIGGGIGIAPLLVLAAELGKKPNADESGGFDFYAGFRSASFGLKLKTRSLVIATEDGSQGKRGRVTDFFNPSGYKGVFACGPEPMLRTVADICVESRVLCFISVERHMACGVGACLGCTVKTSEGNRRCCIDGPVFDAREIYYDN